MGYDAAGLHAGASGQLSVAATAEQVAVALSRTVVTPTMFGRVSAAARLATALDLARQALGRSAAAESVARAALGGRVHATAGMGEALTATTTRIASSGRGPIFDGM